MEIFDHILFCHFCSHRQRANFERSKELGSVTNGETDPVADQTYEI